MRVPLRLGGLSCFHLIILECDTFTVSENIAFQEVRKMPVIITGFVYVQALDCKSAFVDERRRLSLTENHPVMPEICASSNAGNRYLRPCTVFLSAHPYSQHDSMLPSYYPSTRLRYHSNEFVSHSLV